MLRRDFLAGVGAFLGSAFSGLRWPQKAVASNEMQCKPAAFAYNLSKAWTIGHLIDYINAGGLTLETGIAFLTSQIHLAGGAIIHRDVVYYSVAPPHWDDGLLFADLTMRATCGEEDYRRFPQANDVTIRSLWELPPKPLTLVAHNVFR